MEITSSNYPLLFTGTRPTMNVLNDIGLASVWSKVRAKYEVLSSVAQSLQAQIDSISSRSHFDELIVSSLYADNISGTLHGNADTATKLATARTITIGNKTNSFDGSGNIAFTLADIGAQPTLPVADSVYGISISGNAGTATKLATGRAITIGNKANSFDGSGNIAFTLDEIGAVAKNSAISGATKCKITYDAKGLVTGGADLAESDIPSLSISKISNLQSALDGKLNLSGGTLTGDLKVEAEMSARAVHLSSEGPSNIYKDRWKVYCTFYPGPSPSAACLKITCTQTTTALDCVFISRTGNVGIGSTFDLAVSSDYKLNVDGHVRASGDIRSEGGVIGMRGVAAHGIADLTSVI